MSAQVIPLSSDPNQSFSVQLQVDGAPLTLNITISWSSMAGYWVMSVFDVSGNLLADSIPMITGWYPGANLLAQQVYLAIGSAFIINNGNSEADYPGVNDLGANFSLLWDDTPVNERTPAPITPKKFVYKVPVPSPPGEGWGSEPWGTGPWGL